MKLTVLCDNNTFIDNYLLAEPALSFYIENGKDKILFDLGYSDVYKKNAQKLKIDLNKVNKIALSHGHNDHTGGLACFDGNQNVELYCCNGCFDKKREGREDISAPITEEVATRFKLIKCERPVEISKNLYFLGRIPRGSKHESYDTKFETLKNGKWEKDFNLDDSCLIYRMKDGLAIITGCSHSGICNMINFAKSQFNSDVKVVIGGLHLKVVDNDTQKTIKFLKKQKGIELYPCHCTSLLVKAEMLKMGIKVFEVGSGLKVELT